MESSLEVVKNTPDRWVLLVFDEHYRIGCREDGLGGVQLPAKINGAASTEPQAAAIQLTGCEQVFPIAQCTLEDRQTSIYVVVSAHCKDPELKFYSLRELSLKQADGALRPTPECQRILSALDGELHRLPYLDLGEHEYIYRFRTPKERNRDVYVDDYSQALYQSKLCSVIKALRRKRENAAGEPAYLDFGPVRYILPSHFGFCLGVQNAIERAYETVAQNPGKRVFMLSELIHNPFVNKDLLDRGLRYLQTDKGLPYRTDGEMASGHDDPDAIWNQLAPEDIVIIPAFGATNEDKARLIRSGISIRRHDATCMLVEKVWKAARRYASEGYTVLIHGKSEHEETKATFSNSSSFGPALMLRNMAHAEALAEVIRKEGSARKTLFESAFAGLYSRGFDPEKDLERIAVVNQTTLLSNQTLAIIEFLRTVMIEKYGEEKIDKHVWSKGKGDTLCYATQVNQDALHRAMEGSVDCALVLGGRNSSNTYQLYHVCREHLGENAHYIQSEANILSRNTIRHFSYPLKHPGSSGGLDMERPFLPEETDRPITLLLTGGASCPDGIIQQVITRVNRFFPAASMRSLESILAGLEQDG